MNDPTQNMYHNMIEGNRFRSRMEDYEDLCNECNSVISSFCCNKCANGVCENDKCGWLFPHHHQTNYVICTSCVDAIDNKLTILVDYSKLVLLKKKIHKKLQRTMKTLDNCDNGLKQT